MSHEKLRYKWGEQDGWSVDETKAKGIFCVGLDFTFEWHGDRRSEKRVHRKCGKNQIYLISFKLLVHQVSTITFILSQTWCFLSAGVSFYASNQGQAPGQVHIEALTIIMTMHVAATRDTCPMTGECLQNACCGLWRIRLRPPQSPCSLPPSPSRHPVNS